MYFLIKGEPKPKQSARFRIAKSGDKSFIMSYQKKAVKQAESDIISQILGQLPAGFEPLKGKLAIKKLHYVFAPIKSLKKADLELINSGGAVYKSTKPDLTDNLSKGLFDALEGIVYLNDSQICSIDNVRKFYGNVPRIELVIEEMS